MNHVPSNLVTPDLGCFKRARAIDSPLRLEGSLAACLTLAPVLPIFPFLVCPRSAPRRHPRRKP